MKKYLAIPSLVFLLAGCGMTDNAAENNANGNTNMYDQDVNDPNFNQRGTTENGTFNGGVTPNEDNVTSPDGFDNGGNMGGTHNNTNGTNSGMNEGLGGTETDGGTNTYDGTGTMNGTNDGMTGGAAGQE